MRRLGMAVGVVAAVLGFMLGTAVTAHAAVVHKRRVAAIRWAERQAGKPYEWGGTGPAGFDCSGLVYMAYGRGAHVWLPRTTYGMATSRKLVHIPWSQRRRGDIAAYGSGHVELVTRFGRTTFGALEPGTRIGWHHFTWSGSWHPTVVYRLRY